MMRYGINFNDPYVEIKIAIKHYIADSCVYSDA